MAGMIFRKPFFRHLSRRVYRKIAALFPADSDLMGDATPSIELSTSAVRELELGVLAVRQINLSSTSLRELEIGVVAVREIELGTAAVRQLEILEN